MFGGRCSVVEFMTSHYKSVQSAWTVALSRVPSSTIDANVAFQSIFSEASVFKGLDNPERDKRLEKACGEGSSSRILSRFCPTTRRTGSGSAGRFVESKNSLRKWVRCGNFLSADKHIHSVEQPEREPTNSASNELEALEVVQFITRFAVSLSSVMSETNSSTNFLFNRVCIRNLG